MRFFNSQQEVDVTLGLSEVLLQLLPSRHFSSYRKSNDRTDQSRSEGCTSGDDGGGNLRVHKSSYLLRRSVGLQSKKLREWVWTVDSLGVLSSKEIQRYSFALEEVAGHKPLDAADTHGHPLDFVNAVIDQFAQLDYAASCGKNSRTSRVAQSGAHSHVEVAIRSTNNTISIDFWGHP